MQMWGKLAICMFVRDKGKETISNTIQGVFLYKYSLFQKVLGHLGGCCSEEI